MKDIMTQDLVLFDLAAKDKEAVIRSLAEAFAGADRLADQEAYIAAVHERESTFSTAVGYGVAIPHAKTDAVKEASVGFARLSAPIPWGEDEMVDKVFLLAMPEAAAGDKHLEILAGLARNLIHEAFRDKIDGASDAGEIMEMVNKF